MIWRNIKVMLRLGEYSGTYKRRNTVEQANSLWRKPLTETGLPLISLQLNLSQDFLPLAYFLQRPRKRIANLIRINRNTLFY